MWPRILLLITLLAMCCAEEDWASCPSYCKCKWTSGKKNAECINASLNTIPTELSSEIQILSLNDNSISELPRNVFLEAKINNLHRLLMRSCGINNVHEEALNGLSILIEIDLSKNNIRILHSATFHATKRIRVITLNNNLLEKLEEGLFKDLKYLQNVEIRNNRLKKIGMFTFVNVPALTLLSLDDNNLSLIKVESLSKLTKLTSLTLHNNPWHCDCKLKKFRDWAIERNLYTMPTACAEPSYLQSKFWSEVDSDYFACKPRILEPRVNKLEVVTENVTIVCQATADPIPDLKWLHKSKIITPHNMGDRYVLADNAVGETRWMNLTIVNVRYQDRGEYKCVASNRGGIEERNITLECPIGSGDRTGFAGGINDHQKLIIGLIVGALILIIISLVLCCLYCRKRTHKRHNKSDVLSPNGDSILEGSVIPEMEKSLLTAVNPVVKPPRRCEVPSSVSSAATEMCEQNRTLLDNDSVFAGAADDESRSIDFAEPLPKHTSQDTLNMDYRKDNRAYPPDLLSFPPRADQVSPAGSSASTAPDNSRLPPQHGPQSPIHSPIYGTNPNLFRTLPYSRSQSPFTAPVCAPVVHPRAGYVTIPRRPRVPSWASAPPATPQLFSSGDIVEPVYDNLGLRTTADGSSVLSLNKVCSTPTQQYSPAMRGRPLPATPTFQTNGLPTHYAPIQEQETGQSPTMARAASNYSVDTDRSNVTTPVRGHDSSPVTSPSQYKEVSATDTGTGPSKRSSWIRPGPDGASLRRHDTENELSYPLPNGDTPGRVKVPPRPPPKPKKKVSSKISNGPLYEDEGEDGTEV